MLAWINIRFIPLVGDDLKTSAWQSWPDRNQLTENSVKLCFCVSSCFYHNMFHVPDIILVHWVIWKTNCHVSGCVFFRGNERRFGAQSESSKSRYWYWDVLGRALLQHELLSSDMEKAPHSFTSQNCMKKNLMRMHDTLLVYIYVLFIYLFIFYLFIYVFIYLFIYLLIYLSIYLFIYSFIYLLFIYWFIV